MPNNAVATQIETAASVASPAATSPAPAPTAATTLAGAAATPAPAPDGSTVTVASATPEPEHTPSAPSASAATRRSRPPPAGWERRFWPDILHREFDPVEPSADKAIVPKDTVRLDYDLVLHGGCEEVVRVKSQLVLPLALEVENLPQTDVAFPELFDQVIVRPLVTKFRAFLQRLFDAASLAQEEAKAKQTAAEPALPPNHNGGYKPPKPTNGAMFTMPEIDAKPPLPTRPGSRAWAGTNNGIHEKM